MSGACFAEFGHDVVCVDKDPSKIERLERGEIPIYEPGLDDLVARNTEAGRLTFSTSLADSVQGVDAVFIAVGPPSRRGDGHADLRYVFAAAEEVARALGDYAVIVTKSTVPVGTGRKVQQRVREANPRLDFDVASNPEFLREGSAIEDFMRPDRVVVGCESERAREVMSGLYRPLNLNETPIMFTALETAELIKYAANAFLATKITFINEVADLCEAVGADVQDVAKGIGLDNRIGRKFLHAGPGYGGSCFPKDTLALLRTAEENDVPARIVETVVEVNDRRKRRMVHKIAKAADGAVRGKRIAVLGVTFKPNTDDMRESPSLVIVPALLAEGAEVVVFDPEGRTQGEPLLPGVSWAADAYEAIDGADLLVLLTEWNAFRALDLDRVKQLLKSPTIVDLRNIYKVDAMREAGFRYISIGRAEVDTMSALEEIPA
ncbi:MAG: UDP-glucose dehydrogenase family protein [Geminicoccaceae bacterium]